MRDKNTKSKWGDIYMSDGYALWLMEIVDAGS